MLKQKKESYMFVVIGFLLRSEFDSIYIFGQNELFFKSLQQSDAWGYSIF